MTPDSRSLSLVRGGERAVESGLTPTPLSLYVPPSQCLITGDGEFECMFDLGMGEESMERESQVRLGAPERRGTKRAGGQPWCSRTKLVGRREPQIEIRYREGGAMAALYNGGWAPPI